MAGPLHFETPTALEYFAALVAEDEGLSVLEAAISIAQDEYPQLDAQDVLAQVDELADRLRRRIHIAKSGSRATVVWTPWTEKADKMGDFGPDGWRGMVCVESANAAQNTVTVRPGGSHTLTVEYRAENM